MGSVILFKILACQLRVSRLWSCAAKINPSLSSLRSVAGGQRIDLDKHFFFEEKKMVYGYSFHLFFFFFLILWQLYLRKRYFHDLTRILLHIHGLFSIENNFFSASLRVVTVKTSFGHPYFKRSVFLQADTLST